MTKRIQEGATRAAWTREKPCTHDKVERFSGGSGYGACRITTKGMPGQQALDKDASPAAGRYTMPPCVCWQRHQATHRAKMCCCRQSCVFDCFALRPLFTATQRLPRGEIHVRFATGDRGWAANEMEARPAHQGFSVAAIDLADVNNDGILARRSFVGLNSLARNSRGIGSRRCARFTAYRARISRGLIPILPHRRLSDFRVQSHALIKLAAAKPFAGAECGLVCRPEGRGLQFTKELLRIRKVR